MRQPVRRCSRTERTTSDSVGGEGSNDPAEVERALSVLTTEHYALQMIRSATVFDAGNRAGHYLTTVSAALVALGLISQVASPRRLAVLVMLIFFCLYLIGLTAALRAVESSIEDVRCGLAIGRIRSYYRAAVPAASAHLTPRQWSGELGVAHRGGHRGPVSVSASPSQPEHWSALPEPSV